MWVLSPAGTEAGPLLGLFLASIRGKARQAGKQWRGTCCPGAGGNSGSGHSDSSPADGQMLAGAKRRGHASPGARLSGKQRPAKSAAGQSGSEHGGTAEENSNVSKGKTQDPGASESPLLFQSSPEASFAWFGVDVYGREFRLVLEQEGVYM